MIDTIALGSMFFGMGYFSAVMVHRRRFSQDHWFNICIFAFGAILFEFGDKLNIAAFVIVLCVTLIAACTPFGIDLFKDFKEMKRRKA